MLIATHRRHTGGMGADRVEVAQQHDAPLLVCSCNVAKHVLDHELGASIGADCTQAVLLVQWHVLGVAVHRAGAGKHNLRRNAMC